MKANNPTKSSAMAGEATQYLMTICPVPKEIVDWQDLEDLVQMGFGIPSTPHPYIAAGLLTQTWKGHPAGSAIFVVSQTIFYVVNPGAAEDEEGRGSSSSPELRPSDY